MDNGGVKISSSNTGQRGELLVAEKLLEHGWSVARPFDSASYDLVGVKKGRLVCIQVKSTLGQHHYKNNTPHYQFLLGKGKYSKCQYTRDEVNFYVCVGIDQKRFWIFPFDDIKVITVKIYDSNPKYRKWENAWELLEA